MEPLIGAALIGGGASLLGGLMGSSGAKRQNAMQEQLAQRAQNFEAHQSATAHQREVIDLRAAGLNPILSGTGGMGASTAKGIMAQQVNEMAPLDNAMNAGANTAMTAMRTKLELDNLKATNRNITEDSDLKRSAQQNNSVLYNKLLHEVDTAKYEKDMAEADSIGRKTEGDIDKSTWGRVMRYINRANPLGSTGSSAVRALRGR